MKILLTNDDGIDSEGIQKLAELLRAEGKHKVYVLAPDANRSGISNALALINGPVKITTLGGDNWSCSGFPADCVLMGLKGVIFERPDIVISGINRGANLGIDIIYSGTAAAARQASLTGVPAIALSLVGAGPYNWDMAASWATGHLEELLSHSKEGAFLNVNIPNGSANPEGMEITWPALKSYADYLKLVDAMDGSRWCFLYGEEEIIKSEAGSDCNTVSRNFVSVSVVRNYPVVWESAIPNSVNN